MLSNALRDLFEPASEDGNCPRAGLVGKRFLPFPLILARRRSVEGHIFRLDRVVEVVLEDAVGVERVPFVV